MRKIIILEKRTTENYIEVSYLFWLTVPLAQQIARVSADAKSVYIGATVEENASLKDGSVLEKGGMMSFNASATLAQIGAALVTKFNVEQTALNASAQFSYFGSYWDGTSWTLSN